MFLKNFRFKSFLYHLYNKAMEEDIMSSAAQVAFYFSFALFPMLLFLISLLGIILGSADDLRTELFFYLKQVMPITAYQLVETTIVEVTTASSGGKLTLGFFIALWSASAGVDSLRIGLNSVYNLRETRDWWKTKLLSLSFTFVITVLVSVALAIVFYGWKFISLTLTSLSLPVPAPFFLVIIQWVALLVVLIIIFGLMFNYIPNHSPVKWVWITPGAITGIILWLLLSNIFRMYLNYFNTYNKTYGSLGAVIILMLWLYLTSLVILVGGLINSILDELGVNKVRLKNEIKINDSGESVQS